MIAVCTQNEATQAEGISEFAMRLIKKKARMLVGLTSSDASDLEQDLVLRLLESQVHYTPELGHPNVFATMVIERVACSIIRREQAKKRGLGQITQSLDEPVWDADGNQTTLGETLADDQRQTREDYLPLAFDVHTAILAGHYGYSGIITVDDKREIELFGNGNALLGKDFVYRPAFGSSLLGNKFHTEYGVNSLNGLVHGFCDTNATTFTSTTGMYLGFDCKRQA